MWLCVSSFRLSLSLSLSLSLCARARARVCVCVCACGRACLSGRDYVMECAGGNLAKYSHGPSEDGFKGDRNM